MKESMDQEISWYEDAWRRGQVRGRGRGQGNFKLAANFGYNSRGSADPRESLRKRRISKLALTAHKVSSAPGDSLSSGWILTTGRDGVVVCYTFFP